MKQVRVVHSSVAKVYNGEEIAGFIADIQAKSSQTLRYVVCDNGSTLKKACRLSQLPQVSDVGHAMGRCLEKAFKKDERYQNWSKAVSQWTYKGVNRTYASLLPPKQRTIARFMNTGPVVEWGMQVLCRFEKLPEEARLAFADLPEHQPILMELDAALNLANAVAALLKTDGLCHENVEKCREMADEPVGKTTPERFKTALFEYLDQLDEHVKNTKKRWNASSDVIESMFGKRKAKDAGHPYVQSGIQVIEMPLFAWSEQDVHDKLQQAVEAVSIRQTNQWIDTQFVENQTVSRKKFFEKEG